MQIELEKPIIPHCLTCNVKQTKIVKLVADAKGVLMTTQTFTWICTNDKCIFYLDTAKISTWRRAVTVSV